MSTDPEARLFYGLVQPEADRETYLEIDPNEDDTPWSAIHTKRAHGCLGGIYGYDENLGFFLAIEESLHTADWDNVKPVDLIGLGVQSLEKPWDTQLQQAAEHFGLDVTGMKAGWYLVCLHF